MVTGGKLRISPKWMKRRAYANQRMTLIGNFAKV